MRKECECLHTRGQGAWEQRKCRETSTVCPLKIIIIYNHITTWADVENETVPNGSWFVDKLTLRNVVKMFCTSYRLRWIVVRFCVLEGEDWFEIFFTSRRLRFGLCTPTWRTVQTTIALFVWCWKLFPISRPHRGRPLNQLLVWCESCIASPIIMLKLSVYYLCNPWLDVIS